MSSSVGCYGFSLIADVEYVVEVSKLGVVMDGKSRCDCPSCHVVTAESRAFVCFDCVTGE